jgi:large subunit ribosomal protein L15
MQLHTLAPIHANRRFTVVGRGGKRGKTSGRGGKGQTARAGHKIRPEMRDIIKKIPKRRGWGKNRSDTVRSNRTVFAPINIAALEAAFETNTTITPAVLLARKLVRPRNGRAPKV